MTLYKCALTDGCQVILLLNTDMQRKDIITDIHVL